MLRFQEKSEGQKEQEIKWGITKIEVHSRSSQHLPLPKWRKGAAFIILPEATMKTPDKNMKNSFQDTVHQQRTVISETM
jgi:hypothetical protein